MENIGQIDRFMKKHFDVERWKRSMQDGRKKPQISPGTIAQAVVEMPWRGQQSLLEVDQAARLPEFRAWHGSRRPMVVSDTTMARSLETFALKPVRQALWATAREAQQHEGMKRKLPSGRKAALALLDGSGWGGFMGSVLALVGRRATVVAGYQMSAGRGHELAASRKVLAEARQNLGPGFADLVVGDGLYMTDEDFRHARDTCGGHLLVKTAEETLTVLQDAKELFFGNPAEMAGSLERAKGIDERRGVEYEIIAATGFRWQGQTVKVAWVRETAWKPRKGRPAVTTFWAVTTDESLTAEDMREAAHLRWYIENGVFRRLNLLVKSKRRLTADAHVREALLGLWFLGLNLLSRYLGWTGVGRRHPQYPTAKMTWPWFTRLVARATTRLVTAGT